MSWLSRLFGRLFGRKPRPAAPAPFDLTGAPPPSPSAGSAPPEAFDAALPAPMPDGLSIDAIPSPGGEAVVEVEADEDEFEAEELADDVSPFDKEADLDRRPDLDVIVAERQAKVGDFREEAEHRALSGEQRVRLTDPAGPGTLAEALARLEQEGRVTSRLAENEDGEPVLIYSPVGAGPPAS